MSKEVSSMDEIEPVKQYLRRVGAEVRSMRKAVVKEVRGRYWTDVATIFLEKDGTIKCSNTKYDATEEEAAEIKAVAGKVKFPTSVTVKSIKNAPKAIKEADDSKLFIFRNQEGSIVMVQVRMDFDDKETGEIQKRYVPYSPWSDGEWRAMEPEGSLPLYNADRIKESTTVFIHEGAKAARAVQEMVDGATRDARDKLKAHPWGNNLTGAVHVGWIGGALNPMRTDWKQLNKLGIKRAYIVSDNDLDGRSAVPKISKQLRMKTFHVQFTDQWPKSFDLADPFPDTMFGNANEGVIYTGPSMRVCTHPATWATDVIPNPSGKGRPIVVMREAFKDMWAYIEESDLYVCIEMPEILREERILNKMLAPFSDATDTAKLINKSYQGRSTRLCYRPDIHALVVDYLDSSAINLHVGCSLRPIRGDVSIWLDFLKYMFPIDSERKNVERWCATLIAKPETRMKYGLLLVSEAQGVGKTTLASSVLAPLVGSHNVSYPSEVQILGGFNGWIARKRLAVINEIYSGHSWKAYNTLKTLITDKEVTVNEKYQKAYTLDNWCHMVASSNSMRALKMENDDRRWFYPQVTETRWKPEQFTELYKWLESGGLSFIYQWALDYEDYVNKNERAPMTLRKKDMIEGSRSEAQAEAHAVAEALKDTKAGALAMKDVMHHVIQHSQGRVHDTDYEIRKVMASVDGISISDERIKINNRMQHVIMVTELLERSRNYEDKRDRTAFIRKRIKKVSEILEGDM